MNLPFDSQNDESSGFHSEIQLLIACPFIVENVCEAHPGELISTAAAGGPSVDPAAAPQRTLWPLPIQALCQRAFRQKDVYYQLFGS
jgi:hypothetical protein